MAFRNPVHTLPASRITGQITGPQIKAGAITADHLTATAIDGKTITGALLRSAASANRVEISSTAPGAFAEIDLYTETPTDAPATLVAFGAASGGRALGIGAPLKSGGTHQPQIFLQYTDPTENSSIVQLSADIVQVVGTLEVGGPVNATTTVATSGTSAAAGWSLAAFEGRQFGPVVMVRLTMTRTGAAITADAAGNIGDSLVATLPGAWSPVSGTCQGSYDKGGVADGSVSIGTDGKITLKTLSPTASIATSDTVSIAMTFVQ